MQIHEQTWYTQMIALSCPDSTGQDIETGIVAIRSTHTTWGLCTYHRIRQTAQMLISHYAHNLTEEGLAA